MQMAILERFFARLFLLAVFAAVATAITREECLNCWDQLCQPGQLPLPECARPPNDDSECIDYSEDLNGPELSDNHTLCCLNADGYVSHTVNQSIVQQLTPVFNGSSNCSEIFNEQREGNFDINNFNSIVSQQTQFVFPSIQFGCKGCITNVTFYTRSQQQTNPTIFNILLWGNYRNLTSSSGDSVFVLRQNYSVNRTDQLTFMPWNGNSGFSTTISLGNNDVCFESGHVFGLTVPGSGAFNLEVFREKSSAKTTTVYKRDPLSCESLGRLFYPQSSSIDGNVLIAVGVREVIASSMTPVPSSSLINGVPTTHIPRPTVLSTTDPIRFSQSFEPMTMSRVSGRSMLITSLLPSATIVPPSATNMEILYTALGVVGGVLIVGLSITIAVLFVVLRRQNKSYKPKETQMTDIQTPETTTAQPYSNQYHPYDVAEEFPESRDSALINDYDVPEALNRFDFQSSQMTPINERPSPSDEHYTDMSSAGQSTGGYADETDDRPHYLSPRSALKGYYDAPRSGEESSMGSEYDNPSALFNAQQPINSGTTKVHHYFDLEDCRKVTVQNKDRTYQVLDQVQTEPTYFVLEPGFYVPGAVEREMWAIGNEASQDSIFSNSTSQGTVMFENRASFWEPSDHINKIYDQLSQNKCREIPRNSLRITTQIGSGEFGTVCRGTWQVQAGIKREVAVKQLKNGASDEERAKFLSEGARMMQFFHTNVVKLHGMITVEEPVMMIVELMPVGDLKNYLKSRRNERNPPAQSQLLRFCKDVALGMRHLAKKGFVHRDLAARNILLNESLVCKIGDFGMTRTKSHAYDMTKVEQIPLRWTAPEAIGQWKYTEQSDVYSYGMVLFEIWSIGRKPLPNHDNNTLLQFVKQGGVQYPPPGCPRAIYELMINCWHPVPKQRCSFSDIVEYLNVSDESLLHWSSEDMRVSKETLQLGADLHNGAPLYPDLQRVYRFDDD